jgi:hypothetical protein
VVFDSRPAAFDSSPAELRARRFDFDASRPQERNGLPALPVGRRKLLAGSAGLRVTGVVLRSATAQFDRGPPQPGACPGQFGSRRPVFDLGRPEYDAGRPESEKGRPEFGLRGPNRGRHGRNSVRAKPNWV